MPVYKVDFSLIDSQNRKTSKEFQTADLVDYAAAQAAAAGLATDLGNLTQLRILSYTIKERTVYTDTVDAGANVDEGLTLTLEKENNYNGTIQVPGPIQTIFDGNGNADILDAAVAAFVTNFLTGGEFTFSDGEQANAVVKGVWDK